MLSLNSNHSTTSLEKYFEKIETKPEIIAKERQFEDSLKAFYRQKWNCPLRPPILNGKPVNLYKLYHSVSTKGGWIKVSTQDKWHLISDEMGYSSDYIYMIDNGIKLIYMRYLSKYEEVQNNGDNDDHHDVDIFGTKSRSKQFSNFASGDCPIALPYRDKRVEVFENEYAKIIKSLYSGLPNEVDFAFNIATIMSSPGPHVLKLEKCPFLLKLMIAHAGVYGDDKEIQSLAEEGWKQFCDHRFDEFWSNSGIEDDQILDYIPVKMKQEFKGIEKILFTTPMDFDASNSTCFRILQVTGILRNLSFEPFNIQSLGKSDILIKFMCVCAASKHVRLVNDALDTLTNIGAEIDLLSPEGMYTHVMLLKVISDCLHSDDKNKTLHALEIIAALCQNEKNESVCAEFMDPQMLNRIFQLATVRDILICIHTLETLYQFSELGRASCTRIIAVPNAIEQLVSLLTTDAASFGRTGLSGIQVVESYGHQQSSRQHYPPPPTPMQSHQQLQSQQQQSYRPPTYSTSQPPPPPPSINSSFVTPRPPVAVQRIHHTPQILSQPSVAAVASAVPVTHDEKLRALTTKWIKDNVVAEPGSMAVRGEMYSACVDHLRTVNGIMSGTATLFTSILQSIFSNTTLHSDQRDNKLNYYIEGVRYLKQSNNSVASNHPLMQKILTTPKHALAPVRIIPAIPNPQTNGVTPPKVALAEKPKIAESAKAKSKTPEFEKAKTPESVAENSIHQTSAADVALEKEEEKIPSSTTTTASENSSIIHETSATTISEVKEKVPNRVTTPENLAVNNGIVSYPSSSPEPESETIIENGINEDHNNPKDDKLDACSSPNEVAATDKIIEDEEKNNEVPIIRVENLKTDIIEDEIIDGEEDELDLSKKQLVNGHIKNGDSKLTSEGEEKKPLRNGIICNGVSNSPSENVKENGITKTTIHETREEAMEIVIDGSEEILNEVEDNGEELPPGDPAKIDETVEAVSKAPLATPKNGIYKATSQAAASKKVVAEDAEAAAVLVNGTKGKKRKAAATPKTSNKKKARTNTETSNSVSDSQNAAAILDHEIPSTSNNNNNSTASADLMCEWNACGQMFSTSEFMSAHIIRTHLIEAAKNEDGTFLCLWPGCNKTRRGKWSLVTHFQDHHCQEHQLRNASIKRNEVGGASIYLSNIRQQFAERATEPEIIPTYTQAAAMDAIRRHSVVHFQREVTDEQEGPVTKCIRLTTALILRNIARYSEEGRCKLRRFELQLCPLALSRLEAGGALVQCLSELDNTNSEEAITKPSIFQPPTSSNSQQPLSESNIEPTFAVPYLPVSKQQQQQ